MRHILCILFLALSVVIGDAATRKALQIDVSGVPVDGNTLVINGVTRTWKTSVVTPATQIAIAGSAALSKEKLFSHIASNPFAGPLILQSVDADSIKLTAQVDGALTYSQTGSWATFTLSTLTVASAYNVRMPITVEPAATRIVIANDLVTALASATGTFATADAHMANFASLTGTQIVSNKSLQSGNIDSITLRNGSTDNNTSIETAAYEGIHFNNYNNLARKFTIRPNNNGYPSLFDTSGLVTDDDDVSPTDATLSANGDALLNVYGADARYLRKTAANTITGAITTSANITATGVSTFSNINASTINGSTIATAASIGGTIGSLSGGTIAGSTVSAATVTGQIAFDSDGQIHFGRRDDTAVTGGNATINPDKATFIRITGLTGDADIVGITGGADGRMLYIYNNHDTYDLKIMHDSSLETTAANRIYTNTKADKSGSNGFNMGIFIYDSSASRWIMLSWET
jgi:hypothetical protein|tara:strand:- start:1574 stop:2965 length:1392 start_codon:yes stop_codon:yes gene_type:complete